MKLIEVIGNLENYEGEATIYAAEPWTQDSLAMVAFEPDAGGLPREAVNLSYFLEVFIARDFLEDWMSSLKAVPSREDTCKRLISYAINDA